MSNYADCIAIIPTYDAYANNYTRLIRANGEETIIPKPIHDFIDELHLDFRQSFKTNSIWASYYLFQKKYPPIYLDATHVFLTFKARSGIAKRHGCFGYISIFDIEKFEDTTIYLTSGEAIPTCSTNKQLRNFFIHAFIVYCVSFCLRSFSSEVSLRLVTLMQSFHKNAN